MESAAGTLRTDCTLDDNLVAKNEKLLYSTCKCAAGKHTVNAFTANIDASSMRARSAYAVMMRVMSSLNSSD